MKGTEKYSIYLDEETQIEIDANELTVIAEQRSERGRSLLIDGHPRLFEDVEIDYISRKISFRLDSIPFEALIENETDILIRKLGMMATSQDNALDIFAPMPGLVLEVMVKQGEQVKSGQPMIILQAMKMENILTASGDGLVAEILVEINETVDKNTLMIKVEVEDGS